MKIIFSVLIFATLTNLLACKDERVTGYRKIVNETADFKINLLREKKSFFLRQNAEGIFRQILIDEIRPDTIGIFVPDTRIDFYDRQFQVIASISIVHDDNRTANFSSGNLNFGFRLPYRLAMSINELRYNALLGR